MHVLGHPGFIYFLISLIFFRIWQSQPLWVKRYPAGSSSTGYSMSNITINAPHTRWWRSNFVGFFNLETAPNKSRIADWVEKFDTDGTVQDLHTKSEDRASHSGPSQPLWTVPATLDRASHSGPSQPLWTVPATLDDQEPVQMKLLTWFKSLSNKA